MPKTISFWDHPIATLEKALDLRKQIESLKASVADILGGHENGNAKAPKRRGRPPKAAAVAAIGAKVDGRKGKKSAATIAKMKAAQKARWAKLRGEATPAAAEPAAKAPKKKRTMSPEARAKIAAAQRARWAKVKR